MVIARDGFSIPYSHEYWIIFYMAFSFFFVFIKMLPEAS